MAMRINTPAGCHEDSTNDLVFYLFTDHLGSTNVVSDPSGQMVSLSLYKPWGESRGGAGTRLTDYGFTGQRNMHYIKVFGGESYVLAEEGMEIGSLITDQKITPGELSKVLFDRLNENGAGSNGRLNLLQGTYGPLRGSP